MDTIDVVKLWKKSKIEKCEMTFSCGGDSMNDYHFKFFDKENKEVRSKILQDYFENEVYNEVTFYEASDGHYIGEFGVVTIELDDEGIGFNYFKQSKSEWSESYTDIIQIKLTKKEADFIRKNVLGFNGNCDEDVTFVYKHDFFMSDEDEKTLASIDKKIYVAAEKFEPETDGDINDWFSFTSALQGDIFDDVDAQIKVVGNKLHIRVTREVTEIKEEDE
jgi:hypothetical protein